MEQLNIKTKSYKDLLTDEPFTRQDLITLQVTDTDSVCVYDCWLSMTKSGCCYVSMAGFIHKKLESSTFQTTVGQLVWSLYMAVCKNLCFLCDYSVMKWQVECTVCSQWLQMSRETDGQADSDDWQTVRGACHNDKYLLSFCSIYSYFELEFSIF